MVKSWAAPGGEFSSAGKPKPVVQRSHVMTRSTLSSGLALFLVVALHLPAWAACGCGSECTCGPGCRCAAPAGFYSAGPLSPATAGLAVRKNQSTLTDREKIEFIDALRQLKNTYRPGETVSVYDQYVRLHQAALHKSHIHDGPHILPWHRQFLADFERELQRINPAVTIPYWDFTVDRTLKASLFDPGWMGGSGDPNLAYTVTTGPFAAGLWTLADGGVLRRAMGELVGLADELPTAAQVDAGLKVPFYDVPPFDSASDLSLSFRAYMVGDWPSGFAMHTLVHWWVGGTFLSDASPDDPLFWLFHSNLDRIWGEWEARHGLQYSPVESMHGQGLYDMLYGLGATPAGVLDHHLLGYRYDTEPVGGAVPEPGGWALLGTGALALAAYLWRGKGRGTGRSP
jgi:tyrosinase